MPPSWLEYRKFDKIVQGNSFISTPELYNNALEQPKPVQVLLK